MNLITLRPIGRSGSFFLQNLLDGHPDLMAFPIPFPFYYHWYRLHVIHGNPSRDEIIAFFIERTSLRYLFAGNTGVFSPLFYSYTDKASKKVVEYKIEKEIFLQHLLTELGDRTLSRRDFLIALHVAYERTTGEYSPRKRNIFLHEHYSTFPEEPLRDFPESKHIFMTRSALSSYASYIKFNEKYRGIFAPLYQCIDLCDSMRARVNARALSRISPTQMYTLSTEELNAQPEVVMQNLLGGLKLPFSFEMLRPTFAGHDKEGISMFSQNQKGFDQSGMNQDRSQGVCSTRETTILSFLFPDLVQDDPMNHGGYSSLKFFSILIRPDFEVLKLRYQDTKKLLSYLLVMGPIMTRLAFLWCYIMRDRNHPLLPSTALLWTEEALSRMKLLKKIFRVAN